MLLFDRETRIMKALYVTFDHDTQEVSVGTVGEAHKFEDIEFIRVRGATPDLNIRADEQYTIVSSTHEFDVYAGEPAEKKPAVELH